MYYTGYVIVLPCIDRWVTVDMRTKAFSVPPQMVCIVQQIVHCVLSDVVLGPAAAGRTKSEVKKSEKRYRCRKWNFSSRKKTEMVWAHLADGRWQTAEAGRALGDGYHTMKTQ